MHTENKETQQRKAAFKENSLLNQERDSMYFCQDQLLSNEIEALRLCPES